MSSRKRKRSVKNWPASEHAGKERELAGVLKWIEVLQRQLKKRPDDRWAQGMLTHYLVREQALSKEVKSVKP